MRLLSLFFLLLQLPQVPPGVPGPPASVDGIVFDSETKQPLPGATISLQDRNGTGGKMITVTGNDGRFALHNVPPGQYLIEASRSGYVSEVAGNSLLPPNLPPNTLMPINIAVSQQLTAGQTLSDLRLVLTPGGVITGRLTDDHGEAVVGAVVQALKTTHRN